MARLGRGYPIRPHILQSARSAYAAAVLSDLPLAAWTQDHDPGYTDYTGNGHDLTGIGTITYGGADPGVLTNTSSSFPGTAGSETPGAGTWAGGLSTFSAECWFKASAVATNGSVLMALDNADFAASDSRRVWNVTLQSGGNARFECYNTVGGVGTALSSGTNYANGLWHHAVATYNAGAMVLYIDGAQVATGTQTGTLNSGGTSPFSLASCNAFSTFADSRVSLNGSMAFSAVYPTALSGTRVSAHYRTALGGAYPAAVLPDAPLGYWRLGDRASGLVCSDFSGHSSPLAYQSAVTSATSLITDPADAAITATADTQYADSTSTNSALYGISGNVLTVEAWVKWSVFQAGDHHILGSTQGGGTNADRLYFIRRNSDAALHVGWLNSTYKDHTFTPTLTTGVTYHLVVTFDGTNGRLYVNGALSQTISQIAGSLATGTSGDRWRIGVANYVASSGTQADGVLDEVAVYNTALSSTRVLAHYSAGVGGSSISGTSSSALGALTVSSAGTRTHSTTATAPLGALTVAATSTRKTFGTASAPLGALTVTATSHATKTGTAAAPLGALVVTSRAATVGRATVTLGSLTVTSTGFRSRPGTAALPLGSLAVASAGTVRHPGSGSVALGSLTVASTGGVVHVVSGTAAVLLGSVAMDVIGHPVRIPPRPISVVSAGSTSVVVTAAVSGVAYTAAYALGQTVVQVGARGRHDAAVLVDGGTAVSLHVSARQLVGVTVQGRTVVTLLYNADDGQGNNPGNDIPLFGNDPQISNNQPITAGIALTGNYISGEEA